MLCALVLTLVTRASSVILILSLCVYDNRAIFVGDPYRRKKGVVVNFNNILLNNLIHVFFFVLVRACMCEDLIILNFLIERWYKKEISKFCIHFDNIFRFDNCVCVFLSNDDFAHSVNVK